MTSESLDCGFAGVHNYCTDCIDQALASNPRCQQCPQCRRDVPAGFHLGVNRELDDLVRSAAARLQPQSEDWLQDWLRMQVCSPVRHLILGLLTASTLRSTCCCSQPTLYSPDWCLHHRHSAPPAPGYLLMFCSSVHPPVTHALHAVGVYPPLSRAYGHGVTSDRRLIWNVHGRRVYGPTSDS